MNSQIFTFTERTVKRHSHADAMKQIVASCNARKIRGICLNNFPRLNFQEMEVKNLTTKEMSELVDDVVMDSIYYA